MTTEVKQVFRLTTEQFAQLKKSLPNSIVNSQTTPTQAAYQLGVQHVLQVLRDGWVVE